MQKNLKVKWTFVLNVAKNNEKWSIILEVICIYDKYIYCLILMKVGKKKVRKIDVKLWHLRAKNTNIKYDLPEES